MRLLHKHHIINLSALHHVVRERRQTRLRVLRRAQHRLPQIRLRVAQNRLQRIVHRQLLQQEIDGAQRASDGRYDEGWVLDRVAIIADRPGAVVEESLRFMA